MSLRIRVVAALGILALSLPASLRAEEEVEEIASDDFTQSVSLSVTTLLGSPAATYEYLAARRHGLIAEAAFAAFGDGAGSWSAGAGYRYHFHPGMESLFAGAFLRYGDAKTEIPLEENDETKTFGVEGSMLILGANLGYRWQWQNAISLTLRGGYGIPLIKDLAWSPSDPEDSSMKDLIEALMGLDLELGVGYSF